MCRDMRDYWKLEYTYEKKISYRTDAEVLYCSLLYMFSCHIMGVGDRFLICGNNCFIISAGIWEVAICIKPNRSRQKIFEIMSFAFVYCAIWVSYSFVDSYSSLSDAIASKFPIYVRIILKNDQQMQILG